MQSAGAEWEYVRVVAMIVVEEVKSRGKGRAKKSGGLLRAFTHAKTQILASIQGQPMSAHSGGRLISGTANAHFDLCPLAFLSLAFRNPLLTNTESKHPPASCTKETSGCLPKVKELPEQGLAVGGKDSLSRTGERLLADRVWDGECIDVL